MRILLPDSVSEACDMLARTSATPIAGGTDLLVHWPQQSIPCDQYFIDLSPLAELRTIRWTNDALILGAGATYWDVIQDQRIADEFPMLIEAARQVGAIQIQTRGTWGGNIMNASPAADGVPVLMAYDAILEFRSAEDVREYPLDAFYLDYKKMSSRPGDLLCSIRIPRRSHDVQIFHKVGARRAQAITKIGAAIAHSDAGWRIVANSAAPTVRRCRALEQLLESRTPVRQPHDLLQAIDHDVAPIDDIRSSAAYRRTVLSRILHHHLRSVHPGFE